MSTFRILFYLTVTLLCSLDAMAQSYHINLFGGANYSSLSNEAFDLWKPGPSFGLGFETRFTDILFLEAGIVYNERGARQSYEIFALTDNLPTSYPPVVLTHQYLSVPISIGVRTRGKFAVFAQFSTVFSRILRSNAVFVTYFEQNEVVNENKAYHPKLDLTLQLSTGAIVELSRRAEGFVRFSFEHGINNTYGYSGGDPHIGFLGQIGLKYRVGKFKEE